MNRFASGLSQLTSDWCSKLLGTLIHPLEACPAPGRPQGLAQDLTLGEGVTVPSPDRMHKSK